MPPLQNQKFRFQQSRKREREEYTQLSYRFQECQSFVVQCLHNSSGCALHFNGSHRFSRLSHKTHHTTESRQKVTITSDEHFCIKICSSIFNVTCHSKRYLCECGKIDVKVSLDDDRLGCHSRLANIPMELSPRRHGLEWTECASQELCDLCKRHHQSDCHHDLYATLGAKNKENPCRVGTQK